MADGQLAQEWLPEEIPDESQLFMRVHKNLLKPNGKIAPGVFRDQGGAMSTDWEKYRTPNETLSAAKNPSDNGVISLPVRGVREIDCPDQEVTHTPSVELDNRAHTDVKGEKSTEARVKLKRLAYWIIEVSNN